MKAITCHGAGDASVLQWAEVQDPSCAPHELLLRVSATSVNRADLLQRQGHYPPPAGASEILGLEAAGTVDQVGSAVTGVAVGDQVMALLVGGGYAERVAVDERHVLPIPRAVGLPAAGGLMEVFLTAYLNLLELGGLEPGQRVLIHGGSGGVGHAAIQLARWVGAEVWTTASASKLESCRAWGAQVALDYEERGFSRELRGVGGADLILDVIGGKYLDANLSALKPDGRLVVIGLQGGLRAQLNLGLVLSRRLRLIGSTLRALSAERKAVLITGFRERIWPLLDQGRLQVHVDRVLPLEEAATAHRILEGSEHLGKVILAVGPP